VLFITPTTFLGLKFSYSAIRPKNSRLSKAKLIENGFTTLPTWQEALAYYLNELNQGVK
jgi:dTDP-4-dehydrorhamnose reductase